MGTFTIINNSTFADYSALMRVGRLLAGDEYYATHDEQGKLVVNIKRQASNTYVITDTN